MLDAHVQSITTQCSSRLTKTFHSMGQLLSTIQCINLPSSRQCHRYADNAENNAANAKCLTNTRPMAQCPCQSSGGASGRAAMSNGRQCPEKKKARMVRIWFTILNLICNGLPRPGLFQFFAIVSQCRSGTGKCNHQLSRNAHMPVEQCRRK